MKTVQRQLAICQPMPAGLKFAEGVQEHVLKRNSRVR